MDIKFDVKAAERLLQEMDKYCSAVQKGARDILSLMDKNNKWQDNQSRAFQANIHEIAKDLEQALRLESEYMRTYKQRVNELKEG